MKPKKIVRITKVSVNSKTHPCWGTYAQDSAKCDVCEASLECETKQVGI